MRIYPIPMPKPRSFDEQMKDGQSMDDGLAGAKPMFREYEKPYRQVHGTTRCHHEGKDDHDDY